MQLILLRSKKIAKHNLSSDGVNEGDKFELRSGEKFPEEISISGNLNNFITNNQILGVLSDETKKSIMNSIAKKRKERDNNIKSSIANSDDKSVDSKIHHCVPQKLRQKGKLNRSLYDPKLCHNFNHIAIEGRNFSLEDNLQLSSKNEVVFNDIQEVLPGFSHYDPVTDIKCLFISPVDHSRQYLCLQTMEFPEDGFNFVCLRELMEPEWDSED